jgi:hypothetical protein
VAPAEEFVDHSFEMPRLPQIVDEKQDLHGPLALSTI